MVRVMDVRVGQRYEDKSGKSKRTVLRQISGFQLGKDEAAPRPLRLLTNPVKFGGVCFLGISNCSESEFGSAVLE